MDNFPVAASSIASNDPIQSNQSMRESMLLATQLGTYTNFTPKQEATTLATLHLPSVTLANCCTASYRTCDAYAAGDDINVPAQNLLEESGHGRLASYIGTFWEVYDFWLTASSQPMTIHVVSCSVATHAISLVHL